MIKEMDKSIYSLGPTFISVDNSSRLEFSNCLSWEGWEFFASKKKLLKHKTKNKHVRYEVQRKSNSKANWSLLFCDEMLRLGLYWHISLRVLSTPKPFL